MVPSSRRAPADPTHVQQERYGGREEGEAESLIANGMLPLAEIADLCGFSSRTHLTKFFGRVVGTTPGVYRADCQ